jgi:hypothetical protein
MEEIGHCHSPAHVPHFMDPRVVLMKAKIPEPLSGIKPQVNVLNGLCVCMYEGVKKDVDLLRVTFTGSPDAGGWPDHQADESDWFTEEGQEN